MVKTNIGMVSIADGATEQADFHIPRNQFLSSIQIQAEHTYPMHVVIEYHWQPNDTNPEILFARNVKATSGYFDINSIILNKLNDDEKSIFRVKITNQSGSTIAPNLAAYHYDQIFSQKDHKPSKECEVWAYDDEIERHTSAGVIEVTIAPVPGSCIELDFVSLETNFTGAEDLALLYHDENEATIAILMSDNLATGTLYGVYKSNNISTTIASTPESIGKAQDITTLHYPDHIHIITSAVPASDSIIIRIRAKIKDLKPTVTLGTNNQHVAAYTDNYDKVL